MICYKDKTFCKSDCTRTDCYRFLSDEDIERAKEMELPLALSDYTEVCFWYDSPKGDMQ